MKKNIINMFFIVSIIIFTSSLIYSWQNKEIINQNTSKYFPSSVLRFETNFIKTKKGEKAIIKVLGGEKDKVKYSISDASKIKIISSSFQGVIIERLSDYTEDVYISVFNSDYEELYDICYITCYNEILSCEDIYLYKENLNDEIDNTSIALGNGIYYLEFKLITINNASILEENSKQEIKANLSDFFSTEIIEVKTQNFDITFQIDVEIKKVFAFETRKTMSFKVDRASFIYTFQKSI